MIYSYYYFLSFKIIYCVDFECNLLGSNKNVNEKIKMVLYKLKVKYWFYNYVFLIWCHNKFIITLFSVSQWFFIGRYFFIQCLLAACQFQSHLRRQNCVTLALDNGVFSWQLWLNVIHTNIKFRHKNGRNIIVLKYGFFIKK